MEYSSFFNSVQGDRKYNAATFADYFASFIGNGVFPNPATNLKVIANNDMSISINKGKAWINGYFYVNSDDLIKNIDYSDGVLDRIDRVVLRLDLTNRNITTLVKKGIYNEEPEAPELQRDEDIYELGLVDIYISHGTINILQENITDLRLNNDLCGLVHGCVDQVDTSEIFNQFEEWYKSKKLNYNNDFNSWTAQKKQAFDNWYSSNTKSFFDKFNNWYNLNTIDWTKDFNNWFDAMKDKLSDDVAGKLQLEIDKINSDIKESKTFQLNPNGSNASVISYPPDTKGLFYPEVKGVKPIYQSMENGDFSENLNEWRFTNVSAYSIVNNVATFTARAHGGEIVHSSTKIIINHNYLLITRIKADSNKVRYSIAGLGLTSHSGSGNFETMYSTFHYHKSGDYGFSVTDIRDNGWTPIEVDFAMLIDLTQNNLEDKTLDELKKMFNHYHQYGLTTPALSYDLVSRGKNLFDVSKFIDVFDKYKTYYKINDNRTGIYATTIHDTRSWSGMPLYDGLNANTYTITADNPSNGTLAIYDEFTNSVLNTRDTNINKSFTLPTGKFKLKYLADKNAELSNIQIERGAIPTPYEPYISTKTGFSVLPKYPLIQLHNGEKNTITRDGYKIEVGKIILDGTRDWHTWRTPVMPYIGFTLSLTNLKTDRTLVNSDNNFGNQNSNITTRNIYAVHGNFYVTMEESALVSKDVNGFKQWLKENPTTVYYPLAQPFTINDGEQGYQAPSTFPAYQNGDLVQIPTSIREVDLNNTKNIIMKDKCIEILELIDSDGNPIKGNLGKDGITVTLENNHTGVVFCKCRRDPSTCLNIIPNGLIPGNVNQRVEQNTLGIVDINKGISKEEKTNDMVLLEHELAIGEQGTRLDNTEVKVNEHEKQLINMNHTIEDQINNTIPEIRTKNAAIRIETRTSDPSNPEIGRIWLRTDL